MDEKDLIKQAKNAHKSLFDLSDLQAKIFAAIKHYDALLKTEKDSSKVGNIKIQINILRLILDSAALRLLRFNRHAHRTLGCGLQPDHDMTKKGRTNEIKKFKFLINKGNFCIFNDLTNFITLGDILKIEKNGEITLIEVKTAVSKSKPGRKKSDQKVKQEDAMKMVNKNLFYKDGKWFSIIRSSVKARIHIDRVKKLFKIARTKGEVESELNSCVSVRIVRKNFLITQNTENFLKKGHFIHHSLESLKSFQRHFQRNVFPYTVFRLPISMIYDILKGKVIIISAFSEKKFIEGLEKRNFKVEFKEVPATPYGKVYANETKPLEFSEIKSKIIISQPGRKMFLPDNLVPRMLHEFLDVECVYKYIETLWNNTDPKVRHKAMLFSNEEKLFI